MSGELSLAVVIPAYNAGRTVLGAIASAEAVEAAEIIVVDDGSSDATAQIAVERGCEVIRQQNQGAAAARRQGLKAVKSDYVVFLDADDELVPEAIPVFLSFLEERETAIGVFGRYRAWRPGAGTSWLAGSFHPAMDKRQLLHLGFAPGPPGAFIWRRSAVESAMEWSVPWLDLKYAEDFELLIRGLAFGSLLGLNRTLCLYALGGRTKGRELEEERDLARIRSYYGRHFNIGIPEPRVRERMARRLLREGRDLRGSGRPLAGVVVLGLGSVLTPKRVVGRVAGRVRQVRSRGKAR